MRLTTFGLTRGPDSITNTRQHGRPARAVKLIRVRRVTARASQDISSRNAAGFSPELGGILLPLCRHDGLKALSELASALERGQGLNIETLAPDLLTIIDAD